jgi:hypothetical protein
VGESLEDVCETLHDALHVAQHISESLTRLLRDWRVRLLRGWSAEVACAGEFIGIEPVVCVEVEAACADRPL